MIAAINILDQQLRAAGIPIHGVKEDVFGVFEADFLPEATQQQRDQAAAIIAAFDPVAELAALESAIAAEKTNFTSLSADITAELAWITTAIADIDTGLAIVDLATLAQLRVIVKGVMQNQRRMLLEQRAELKAWRYVIRRVL